MGAIRPFATVSRLTRPLLRGIGAGIGSLSGPFWARAVEPAASATRPAAAMTILLDMVVLLGMDEGNRGPGGMPRRPGEAGRPSGLDAHATGGRSHRPGGGAERAADGPAPGSSCGRDRSLG